MEAASHSPQAPGGRKGSEVHLLGSEAHPLDSAVHLQDLVAPPLGLAAPQGSVTGCQIASLTGERVGQCTLMQQAHLKKLFSSDFKND